MESQEIEDVYRHKCDFYEEKSSFKDGSHFLMQQGLVEHVCKDGQANTSRINLSDKARSVLLADFHLRSSEAAVSGLIKPDTLTEKVLFYTARNAPQVDEIRSFPDAVAVSGDPREDE